MKDAVPEARLTGHQQYDLARGFLDLEEQLETFRTALETLVNATMWESEEDARSVRQIARKALASNPARER